MAIRKSVECSRCGGTDEIGSGDFRGGWMTIWTHPGVQEKESLSVSHDARMDFTEFHLCPKCKPEFSKMMHPPEEESEE